MFTDLVYLDDLESNGIKKYIAFYMFPQWKSDNLNVLHVVTVKLTVYEFLGLQI